MGPVWWSALHWLHTSKTTPVKYGNKYIIIYTEIPIILLVLHILTLNISRSVCLGKIFGSATNIIATTLDSYDELIKKYKDAEANLATLHTLGAAVLHGVDVTRMMTLPELRGLKFHRIIYNFPHAGFYMEEDNPVMVMMHSELVHNFLHNASSMLHFDGEIHVNHKTGSPFDRWRIEDLGSEFSLICIAQDEFRIEEYPGYDNKRGSGSRADESFPLGACRTYRFRLCPIAVQNLIRRKLHLIQKQTPMPYENGAALQNHGSECRSIFRGYLKHVDETFGDNSYDVRSSVEEALKLGYERYLSNGGRSSGFISILEELHHLSISISDRLRQMLFRYGRASSSEHFVRS